MNTSFDQFQCAVRLVLEETRMRAPTSPRVNPRRLFDDLHRVLADTHVVEFDQAPVSVIEPYQTAPPTAVAGANFALPHYATYVSDAEVGVLLLDIRPGQRGEQASRYFVSLMTKDPSLASSLPEQFHELVELSALGDCDRLDILSCGAILFARDICWDGSEPPLAALHLDLEVYLLGRKGKGHNRETRCKIIAGSSPGSPGFSPEDDRFLNDPHLMAILVSRLATTYKEVAIYRHLKRSGAWKGS